MLEDTQNPENMGIYLIFNNKVSTESIKYEVSEGNKIINSRRSSQGKIWDCQCKSLA